MIDYYVSKLAEKAINKYYMALFSYHIFNSLMASAERISYPASTKLSIIQHNVSIIIHSWATNPFHFIFHLPFSNN